VRRLYVRKSYVEGDVDFIFGGGKPQMSSATAAQYTPTAYLAGSDGWNPLH
jgi:pectin methylesterase-like acyl-CoA thioesterase